MKNQLKLALGIIVFAVVSLFALLNNASIPIHFFFTTLSVPLVLLMFICLLLGSLAAYFVSIGGGMDKNKRISELENHNKQLLLENHTLQNELQALRNSLETPVNSDGESYDIC